MNRPEWEKERETPEYWEKVILREIGRKSQAKTEEVETLEQQVQILKSAIDPGCSGHPDIWYYVRVQARRFADSDMMRHFNRREKDTLIKTIHNQRQELARLYGHKSNDKENQ